ncbi:hypothetical protein CJ030_MR4G023629 [Morella rubra]|uniref:Uncharacterized protein n=1 Tax=Morella rubra TaxID=262757 RepID=A0A6A1VSU3_9ROSI|nr:hypothetical protein CJ030_MR4G023629 [Morella rubra]
MPAYKTVRQRLVINACCVMNNFCRSSYDVLSLEYEHSSDSEDDVSLGESDDSEDGDVSPTHLSGPNDRAMFRATLPANAHILSDQSAAAMTSLRQQIATAMWATPH